MLDRRRLLQLEAMGVRAWRLRGASHSASSVAAPPSIGDTAGPKDEADATPVSGLDWTSLESRVAACAACALHAGRTQTVFGTGDRNARWMIIGEAPGADEDRLGAPFVGRAGGLLNAMIRALGATREQVYIANIVKCRPPSNRNPTLEEASCCAAYLERQIALVGPELILAVGRVAAGNLLQTDAALGSLRGTVHRYGRAAIPLVATYHPAYLLRKPSEKAKAWADLKLALSVAPVAAGAVVSGP